MSYIEDEGKASKQTVTPEDESSSKPSSTIVEDIPSSPGFGERPQCFKNIAQECLFVTICVLAVAQISLLAGATRSLTSVIGADLKMNDAEVAWILAGQTLTAGTFLLFFGRIADLFGRRWLLIGGMATYSIFLLISGFATNAMFFDIFMGLCGLACASVVPPAIGKLGAVYETPSKRRNLAFGCFGAGNPVGVIMGSWIAGIVSVVSTWRTVLWTMAVLYALFAVLAWFVTPEDNEQRLGGWNRDTFRQFDMTGTAFITVGIAAITAALTEAGVAERAWATSYVIALLVIGIVAIVAFVFWERRVKYPLIPVGAWKDRNFTLLVIILCLTYYAFNSNTFWLTLSWQTIYGGNALEVAIKFLPCAIGGVLMCAIASLIIHRIGNKTMSIISAVCMVISCALLSATNPTISYWALTFPALVLSVISQDFSFCITNLYVVSNLPKGDRSIAGSLVQVTTRVAATIGVGLQTSVFKAVGGDISGPKSMYYRAYQAAIWMSLGGAVISLVFLPFLTVGTQGNESEEERSDDPDNAEKSEINSKT